MVIWAARARADLKAIRDYIAKDSPLNAKRIVRDIHRKAEGLPETPLIERVVPELDNPVSARYPPSPGASSTTCAGVACSYLP